MRDYESKIKSEGAYSFGKRCGEPEVVRVPGSGRRAAEGGVAVSVEQGVRV